MAVYQIFTINCGAELGAEVGTLVLADKTSIPAIIIGETGRGRQRGVLPVQLTKESLKTWKAEGKVTIYKASVGTTTKGSPKLFQVEDEAGHVEDSALAVFVTKMGYRGGNSHTGDRIGSDEEGKPTGFEEFPGTIICEGMIAEGAAGRMGSGKQYVAIVPANTVFRTGYSGRLYGEPSAHYYVYNGADIKCALWEERLASDIF